MDMKKQFKLFTIFEYEKEQEGMEICQSKGFGHVLF